MDINSFYNNALGDIHDIIRSLGFDDRNITWQIIALPLDFRYFESNIGLRCEVYAVNVYNGNIISGVSPGVFVFSSRYKDEDDTLSLNKNLNCTDCISGNDRNIKTLVEWIEQGLAIRERS